MKSSLIAVLIGLSLACVPGVTSAEEGASPLSKLNPFSYKRQKKAPTSARATDSSGGWKMPKLWPSGSTTAQRKPAGPSTWQKMTTGTKNLVSQTADTLNPFNDANDKVEAPAITGSNTMFSQASSSRKPAEKSKSFLPSWLGGEPEEEYRPKTVNEFLLQPKPDFN
jgi:hypothetical protein